MLSTKAMIMPITEALARLAAAAGMTGFTGVSALLSAAPGRPSGRAGSGNFRGAQWVRLGTPEVDYDETEDDDDDEE